VLLSILVFAIFAGEMALRVAREARVTKVQETSGQAFYIAEAGFNEVRASVINGTVLAKICASGPNPVKSVTGTISGSDGAELGTYSVDVTCNDPVYTLVATGNAGSGQSAAHRIISGTVTVTGQKNIGTKAKPKYYNTVTTTYNQ
jgi:hypothetical protein